MLCVCLNTPPHPHFGRRKKWQPTPVFLPGKPHGQRSLAATVHGVARIESRRLSLMPGMYVWVKWADASWTGLAPLSFTIFWSLLQFMHVESVMLSNHLILATLFSFCLQCFPALRSFPMSQLFASGEQSIGASVSASVLPMNIQGWFLLGWTCLIFLQSIRFNCARQPPPVFLPGESQGQRSLVGYSPQGQKELDTTEWLSPAQPSSNGVCVCLCVCAYIIFS